MAPVGDEPSSITTRWGGRPSAPVGDRLGHQGRQRPLEHQALEVGVVDDIGQLRCHVAEIEVDRYGPCLVTADHRLGPFGAVVGQYPDMGAGPDALIVEGVGEPVGPFVELAVGEPSPSGHESRAVGDGVDDHLEQIGQIELPAKPSNLSSSPRCETGPSMLQSGRTDGHSVARPAPGTCRRRALNRTRRRTSGERRNGSRRRESSGCPHWSRAEAAVSGWVPPPGWWATGPTSPSAAAPRSACASAVAAARGGGRRIGGLAVRRGERPPTWWPT